MKAQSISVDEDKREGCQPQRGKHPVVLLKRLPVSALSLHTKVTKSAAVPSDQEETDEDQRATTSVRRHSRLPPWLSEFVTPTLKRDDVGERDSAKPVFKQISTKKPEPNAVINDLGKGGEVAGQEGVGRRSLQLSKNRVVSDADTLHFVSHQTPIKKSAVLVGSSPKNIVKNGMIACKKPNHANIAPNSCQTFYGIADGGIQKSTTSLDLYCDTVKSQSMKSSCSYNLESRSKTTLRANSETLAPPPFRQGRAPTVATDVLGNNFETTKVDDDDLDYGVIGSVRLYNAQESVRAPYYPDLITKPTLIPPLPLVHHLTSPPVIPQVKPVARSAVKPASRSAVKPAVISSGKSEVHSLPHKKMERDSCSETMTDSTTDGGRPKRLTAAIRKCYCCHPDDQSDERLKSQAKHVARRLMTLRKQQEAIADCTTNEARVLLWRVDDPSWTETIPKAERPSYRSSVSRKRVIPSNFWNRVTPTETFEMNMTTMRVKQKAMSLERHRWRRARLEQHRVAAAITERLQNETTAVQPSGCGDLSWQQQVPYVAPLATYTRAPQSGFLVSQQGGFFVVPNEVSVTDDGDGESEARAMMAEMALFVVETVMEDD